MTRDSAFSNPGFRRYYVGAVSGMNATWIFRVLLSWSAWDLTHSASFVGLVAAAGLLPVALAGPFFGVLADRSDIRRAYRRVSLGLLACPVALLGLLGMNWLTPVLLLCLSALYGIVLSAHHPVRQSLGPRLVEPPLIGSVVALSALNFNVARLLSPAIGGVLIGQVGLAVTALVSLALFVPSILIAPTLSPRPNAAGTAQAGLLTELAEGLRTVWERWPVRRSLLLSIFALGPFRAVAELLPVIADGVFGKGAEGLGLLTSAIGFGALIAALFQVVAGHRLLRRVALRYGFVALGFLGGVLMVSASVFEMALLAAPVVGFAGTYVGVSLQIGLQARLEDGLRGRVMSLWMLSTTLSTSLLAVAISVVSEFLGISLATIAIFSICAGAVLLVAAWHGTE
ncbi:MFS transporter [Arenibacterium sp. CAU 1754]